MSEPSAPAVGTQDGSGPADSDATGRTDPTESAAPATPAVEPPTGPADGEPEATRVAQLEREGDVAADYLEELLDIADLGGDIDLDVENGRAMVAVVGEEVDRLAGPNGEVLEALQELTRLAVLTATGERSRLMLDVAGFRARRRAELVTTATDAVARVRASGGPESLPAMTPFERKVVHDAVAAAGLSSHSEGVEPDRHVVVDLESDA